MAHENPLAFPAPYTNMNGEVTSNDGMSLRDYLAAHAPQQPKDYDSSWESAKPQFPTPIPKGPTEPDFPGNNERTTPWDVSEYGIDSEECAEIREQYPEYAAARAAYEEANAAYWKERTAWNLQRELFWETAWRYAYADAMLAQRLEPKPNPDRSMIRDAVNVIEQLIPLAGDAIDREKYARENITAILNELKESL